MPDLENNKVDIDTSGPAMDVDIAEEKDSAEIQQPEIKEEPTIRPVEDETVPEDKTHENEREIKLEENVSEEKKEESKKDELQDYSDSVQKRIAKLTKKWREAERQKDEALTYAKSVLTEKEKAEHKLSKMEPSLLKTTEDSIKSGLESAKAKENNEFEIVKTTQLTNKDKSIVFCEVRKKVYIANKAFFKAKRSKKR